MPNEVTVTARLNVAHGGTTLLGDTTKQVNIGLAGEKFSNRQATSTTPANISLGSIGWDEVIAVWLKNASEVTGEDIIIMKGAEEVLTLKPGGPPNVVTPTLDATAWQAKSATGTPALDVVAA